MDHYLFENTALTLDLGLSVSAAGLYCIFTLTVREKPFCPLVSKYISSLHMHAKPSFAHRLQTAKMASSRTSAQNNGPRAQKNGL